MIQVRFFLLALALAFTPVLLAVDLVEEFPAGWICDAHREFPNLTCRAVCLHYDGSLVRAEGRPEWVCPDSDVRANCVDALCTSEEECRRKGLDYHPCHDREVWACRAKARQENRVTCPVTGPPGSAIKLGDCVLRVVKRVRNQPPVLELRRDCWNPPHDNYTSTDWEPAHPEEFFEWFYSDSP